jgi:hypothetical protein
MKRCIYPSGDGLSSVYVSFEMSKLDMQIKFGTPDLEVLFFGSKNVTVEKSEHDAVTNLLATACKNFVFRL